ncbi:MAG: alkaline phosphatase, partial [Fibrobacter sp.]|nr:alkaline phosphatase [Fibrobacter sp.]
FDLKNPKKPQILDYFTSSTDRGPEGVLFIPAENSPEKGVPFLVVGYEYSTTLSIYRVNY